MVKKDVLVTLLRWMLTSKWEVSAFSMRKHIWKRSKTWHSYIVHLKNVSITSRASLNCHKSGHSIITPSLGKNLFLQRRTTITDAGMHQIQVEAYVYVCGRQNPIFKMTTKFCQIDNFNICNKSIWEVVTKNFKR